MRLGTVMRDVTRRVEAEAAVRELLSERTRLLHESHEQIQTDMHLVRSLLSVQRYRSADPATQTALAEAEQHIQLLTRLYDQIYRSEEVESVALPRLVHDVLADVPLPDETVTIEEEIERISVSRRICVPIAFVVRELVVNALKHAFGTQPAGTIGVTVRRIDDSWLEILVTDDGAGMPVVAGMHASHGFGLAMVTTFAEQFNGSARIEGDRGVRVRVTMQLPKLGS
jgi:two-component sensor histidine kinase